MSKGYYTNKSEKLTEEKINQIIGLGKSNWDILNRYLTDELKIKSEFKFYGVNYGWALRYNKSGKSIIALYPDKDGYMVQLILNKNQVNQALAQVTNQHIKKLINETETIHEGKWIYVKINDKTDLKDIFTLINIRIKIK